MSSTLYAVLVNNQKGFPKFQLYQYGGDPNDVLGTLSGWGSPAFIAGTSPSSITSDGLLEPNGVTPFTITVSE